MAVTRPIGEWPLVLCGPILRKVTADCVTVFVALKAQAQVALKIREPGASGWLHTGTPQQTVALGTRLHVCVATLNTAPALQPGIVYEYDLAITPSGAAGAESLASLDLLTGDYALGYAEGELPGFVLPPREMQHVRIIHGSCRKPHGEGHDLLSLVDDLIGNARNTPEERPHILLLTGDQIYANDVSLALLRSLHDTANDLLGWRETLRSPHYLPNVPGQLASDDSWSHQDYGITDAVKDFVYLDWQSIVDPLRASRISPPLRRKELETNARLSSEESDAHLLFLGEYYTMYLFCWCDALWPRGTTGQLELPEYSEAVPAFSLIGRFSKAAIESQRALTVEFGHTLGKVRRALANVATYMIFDDHEVTDDWNLNHDWVRKVNGSPMGAQVVRNALAAYAVFQDWGNQPEDYASPRKGQDVLDALRMPPGGSPSLATEPGALLDLFNLRSAAADGPAATQPVATRSSGPPQAGGEFPGRKRWHFTVGPFSGTAGKPGFQILALDTRTWRGFPDQTFIDRVASALKSRMPMGHDMNPSRGLVLNAALLSEYGFNEQLTARLSSELVNIVISPAPVFGVPVVEDAVQRVTVQAFDPEVADNEAWSAHEDALRRLVDELKDCRHGVVLLSGDVHYAFSGEIATRASRDVVRPNRIVQLCASSLKNQTLMTHAIGSAGTAVPLVDGIDLEGRGPELLSVIDAQLQEKLRGLLDRGLIRDGKLTTEEAIFLGYELQKWWNETPGVPDPVQRALAFRDLNPFALPGIVPKQLVFGTTVAPAPSHGEGVFENELFWVRFLRDERPDTDRWTSVERLNAARPLNDRAALEFALTQGREIVGYNNVGEIGFSSAADGETKVVHQLYWRGHDSAHRQQDFILATQHTATLRSVSS